MRAFPNQHLRSVTSFVAYHLFSFLARLTAFYYKYIRLLALFFVFFLIWRTFFSSFPEREETVGMWRVSGYDPCIRFPALISSYLHTEHRLIFPSIESILDSGL